MKAFIATVVAALLSFPAIAQEGHTRSQACEELGDAVYSATHATYDIRASREGYGDIHDALPTAQGLAADELDILLDAEAYAVVSDIVDAIVIEIYRMPHSAFTGEDMRVFTEGFQIADRAKKVARTRCMRGVIDIGF